MFGCSIARSFTPGQAVRARPGPRSQHPVHHRGRDAGLVECRWHIFCRPGRIAASVSRGCPLASSVRVRAAACCGSRHRHAGPGQHPGDGGNLVSFPAMDAVQRQRFAQIIAESLTLSQTISEALSLAQARDQGEHGARGHARRRPEYSGDATHWRCCPPSRTKWTRTFGCAVDSFAGANAQLSRMASARELAIDSVRLRARARRFLRPTSSGQPARCRATFFLCGVAADAGGIGQTPLTVRTCLAPWRRNGISEMASTAACLRFLLPLGDAAQSRSGDACPRKVVRNTMTSISSTRRHPALRFDERSASLRTVFARHRPQAFRGRRDHQPRRSAHRQQAPAQARSIQQLATQRCWKRESSASSIDARLLARSQRSATCPPSTAFARTRCSWRNAAFDMRFLELRRPPRDRFDQPCSTLGCYRRRSPSCRTIIWKRSPSA